MSDEFSYYDRRFVYVDIPYYSVGKLFNLLGYEMHPPQDVYGRQIPANSPVHDNNKFIRERFLEILTEKLIEAIGQRRVIVKDEFETIIEPPIKREQLNRARMYKSQIVIFCRFLGIKIVFKTPAEMLEIIQVGDTEKLTFINFDKYIISDDKVIKKELLSEPRSPHKLIEVEQRIQSKQRIQEVWASKRELNNGDSPPHFVLAPENSLAEKESQEAPVRLAIPGDGNVEEDASTLPPGKMPRVAIGRLAVEAAWEIECETGRQATAPDVIKRLQEWAEDKDRGNEFLHTKINRGVKWLPARSKNPKKYETEACGKTLETWNKSRR